MNEDRDSISRLGSNAGKDILWLSGLAVCGVLLPRENHGYSLSTGLVIDHLINC